MNIGKIISTPSVQSLLLQMRGKGTNLATGTGFIVFHNNQPFLITNWHNLAGRNPQTGKVLSNTGGIPDEVVIFHNRKGKFGEWVTKSEVLVRNFSPLWLEHPVHTHEIDVVALPLTNFEDVDFYPYSCFDTGTDFYVGPANPVSVVGFPFGLTAGGVFAVWATGFMATEPNVDQFGLPAFLIDCKARPGQSGSAVIVHRSKGGVSPAGGGTSVFVGAVTKFLGVYSGRINEDSDIGIVWKSNAVTQILTQNTDTHPHQQV